MPPEQITPEVSDPSLTSPAVSAWRTRRLVGIMLVALAVLVGLTLVASQSDPNALDLGATRWLQQFRNPTFAALMYWVSWFGYSPQNFILPLALATPFALRCLWVEALWVLASQAQPWWRWLSMSWCTEPVLRQSWWACSHRCPTRASRAATSCNTPPSSASRSSWCTCSYNSPACGRSC
jgi:hypothetical protein